MKLAIVFILFSCFFPVFGCEDSSKKLPSRFSFQGAWESIREDEDSIYTYFELKEDGSGTVFEASSSGKIHYFIRGCPS